MTDTNPQSKQALAQQKAVDAVKRVCAVAGATKNGLNYVLVIGGLATFYLGWWAYSAESATWWNVVKCVLLAWPLLVLVFAWTVLSQLSEVPESAAKLNQDTRTAYAGMKEVKLREPKGLRGMFSVLNTFRREDSFSVIFDTVGGITLLLNPFFLFIAFLSFVLELLLTFTAVLFALF